MAISECIFRRLGPVAAIAAIVLGTFSCGGSARPNVVLVVVDTLRADHLPMYGYARNTAPRLNQIAPEAFVFDDCVTPIPMTDPAFASLLTGDYPTRHGVRDTGYRLLDSVPSLIEAVQAGGYHTAAIFSREGLASTAGLGRGFDIADDNTLAPGEDPNLPWYTPAGAEAVQRRASEATDRALSWLDERPDGPFFLLLHYFDPHAYYDPPPETLGTFTPEPTPYDDLGLRSWWGPVHSLGTEIARYDEEILAVDLHLDRFLAELRRRGLWENTVFVLTADHGESLGEHGAMDHGEWLWREQIHVPLMIRLPGAASPKPHRIPDLVRLVDVLPTILELTAIDDPSPTDPERPGRSLLPLLTGEGLPPARAVFESENCPQNPNNPTVIGSDCYPPGHAGKLRGVRSGDWKLILTPTREGPRIQLFDVKTDPAETNDVATENPRVVSQLVDVVRRSSAGEVQGIVDEALIEKLRSLGYAE